MRFVTYLAYASVHTIFTALQVTGRVDIGSHCNTRRSVMAQRSAMIVTDADNRTGQVSAVPFRWVTAK